MSDEKTVYSSGQGQQQVDPNVGDVEQTKDVKEEKHKAREAVKENENKQEAHHQEERREGVDDEVAEKRRIEALMEERELSLVEEEKTLITWKVSARPYKERNREYFTTIAAMVMLFSIILVFAKEFFLVATIWAFAFVAYALASVEPETVEHEVSTRGIRTGGKFFRWNSLGRFWFHERLGQRMVSIETFLAFPNQLTMLLGEVEEEKLKRLLRKYLLHETPEPGFLDKAGGWLSKKVPLESE